MPSLVKYFNVLAVFSIAISALYNPQPLHPINIYNSTITFNATNSGFGICDSLQTPVSSRPTFTDCQQAIRHRLPYSPGKGTFHNDGDIDAFSLPVYKSWGSCNITIILGGNGSRTEESSWLEIGMAATEVNEVCRIGEGSGGKIMVGVKNGIWIKLSRYGIGRGGAVERIGDGGGGGEME